MVRSVMTAKVYIFIDEFDRLFAIVKDFEHILKSKLKVHLSIDPSKLFGAIDERKCTTKQIILIKILAAT